MSLLVTLLLNAFMLNQWEITSTYEPLMHPPAASWFDPAMIIVGSIHLLVSCFVVASRGLSLYLSCAIHAVAFFANHFGGIFNVQVLYYALYIGFSVAGLIFRGYFYSFHLLHIIVRQDVSAWTDITNLTYNLRSSNALCCR